jgi:ketosteroid isomerase-like protein
VQDAATLARTMTADVEFLDDTSTVTGRDAVIRVLREDVRHGQLVETTREITIAGDCAWHIVALVQTHNNGDLQARGQALEIWKRVNGAWQLHRRMIAGSATAGGLLKRPSTSEPILDRPGE